MSVITAEDISRDMLTDGDTIRYDTMEYIYMRPNADKASLICRTEPSKNCNEES